MKIFLISDNSDTATGLRLVGVKSVIVRNHEEFILAFEKIITNPEAGVLLISEKLVKNSRELINKTKLEIKSPLIVKIPDRHNNQQEDFITDVHKVIGMKV